MSLDSNRRRLMQKKTLDWLFRKMKLTEMVPAYWLDEREGYTRHLSKIDPCSYSNLRD